MKWYKMYINSMYDIKFKKLAKVGKYDFPLYWTAWSIILNCAADNGGHVEMNDDYEKEILFELLNINLQEIEDVIQELVDVKLINATPLSIDVINWGKYQHASLSTPRVQEHRENKQMEDDVTSVITSLNEIVGKNFRVKTETYRKAIRGRFNDGYTLENMLAVIRHKFNTWHNDPKMKKFITPETLFRPGNFDRYLQEIPEGQAEAMGTGKLLEVENIYGHKSHITQEQFDAAEPDFFHIVKK